MANCTVRKIDRAVCHFFYIKVPCSDAMDTDFDSDPYNIFVFRVVSQSQPYNIFVEVGESIEVGAECFPI